ncbi:PREDICTED: uncharacterized protein LOC105139646 isoform X2 [Populus euphratica]|uniref:Uncharacterized protein LOC105139646 isoform X2 n=1 Tax=Populus euphratica TaxID=75702 RepID=A0AAJ6VBC7_POPEU|nr:PREDICTED: uncharacterized protein LOC105139646 isoform X2 [Populus euphratica]
MQCLMYEIHLDFVKFRLLVCNSVIVIFAPEDTIQTCAGKLVSADAGVILSSQGVVPYFQTRNSGEPGSFKFPSAIVYATSDSSGTIPCISKLSPCQAAYHFLAGYQNGKFVPAYSDSPSIDTLEFAKALSSEVKNESLLNHLMSTEMIRYPILLTTILTQICKSIHLFMLKDNQIPSLLVNVKEGERSLTEAAETSSPIR